jgi:predicted metal-dependent peptidase
VQLARIEDLDPALRERWAAGRVWAAHQAPYLASALLALAPVVVDCSQDGDELDLRGFPTDPRWHVYIDPAVLAGVTVPELGFWLLHQVSHLLREHAARYPGAPAPDGPGSAPSDEQRRWNDAAGAEINDDLHTDKLMLPDGAVTPEQLGLPDGWVAEQYWDALGATEPGNDRRPGFDSGSGGDGQPRPWDVDGAGLGSLAAELLRRDTARQIRDHSDSRGEVPEGWQRWVDEILSPSIHWRQELAAQVRRGTAVATGRVDFTYRRPSRRSSAVPDAVLPSLRQPHPQVALVIDTSGSMSDTMLGQALGEVTGVLRSLGVARRNLKVIACDAQAYRAQSVRSPATITLEGGGGTDMGAGLAAAAALRPRPDLIVVLTDGFTPWPAAAPQGVSVIAGLLDRRGQSPSWAQTVFVGDAAGARA